MDNLTITLAIPVLAQAALLIGHKAGFLPRVSIVPRNRIKGSNGKNTALTVKIADDLDAENYRGVLAQELYESGQLKWLHNQALYAFSKGYKRKLELMGHAVEIATHPEDQQDEIRRREVIALSNYNKIFDKWTDAMIEDALLKNKRKAEAWVRANEKSIGQL